MTNSVTNSNCDSIPEERVTGISADENNDEHRQSPTNGDEPLINPDFEELLKADAKKRSTVTGIVTGKLVNITPAGEPIIELASSLEGNIAARSIVSLNQQHMGNDVVVVFDNGNPTAPIIIGVIQNTKENQIEVESNRPEECEIDGERITFTAEKEIVLKCGKASITLTKAGKILIRGAYLLSRSSGVNRIKGGSVQIN